MGYTGIGFYALSMLCFGITDCLWKKPQQQIGTLPLIILRSSCTSILFGIAYFLLPPPTSPLFLTPFSHNTVSGIWILKAMGICVINYFGLYFYLQSLKHTEVSLTVGFNKIGVILSLLTGYFLYHENFTAKKLVCCILILIGISIIEKKWILRSRPKLSKGLVYTVLSRLFWATGVFFVAFIKNIGVLLFSLILEMVVCSMSIILYKFQNNGKDFISVPITQLLPSLIPLIILGLIGVLGVNVALGSTPVSLLAFIGLLEPATTLIYARFFLKEQLSSSQMIGVGMGIAGTLILTIEYQI